MAKDKEPVITIDVKKAADMVIDEKVSKSEPVSVQPSGKHQPGAAPYPNQKVQASPRKGTHFVVALDDKGEEKGSVFTVPEKDYNRSFSDPKKFKLKKKAI